MTKRHSYCAVNGCLRCLQHAYDELDECDCCGSWHPKTYGGDCRDDANRFASPESFIYWRVTGKRDDLSTTAQKRLGLL